MATIKDIANRLGVSVSTVSKGLNGASDISDELRQMVLDTAVEMGYATKRSKKVENRKLAIFIENMDYEAATQFGYEIVLGFKQNAFRHNWDVTVIPVTPITIIISRRHMCHRRTLILPRILRSMRRLINCACLPRRHL